MKNFSYNIIGIFVLFTASLSANEIDIIQLHSKSLDQLVLETKNNEENQSVLLEDVNTGDLDNDKEENEELDELDKGEESSITLDEEVNEVKSETIFDLDENIILNFDYITKIKSRTLHREFIKILSTSDINSSKNVNENIFFIVKKLYETGEIGKAYNLIKSIDLINIANKKHIEYFYIIELNYLFSTFKLSEVCDLKTFLLNESFNFKEFLLEKTDIFCLTLENKFSEAKLLNSLLLDKEKQVDLNFQNLFKYMLHDNKSDKVFEPLTNINSKDLIFLYSAMLRINELSLNEEFIEVDSSNLLIPVILSNSTNMEIRIKAANKAYFDEVISIESLSALYQSVDFNSNQFNKPEETLVSLNNNKELIMAFYYQLANIQIFPEQRLNVILDYWKFAKEQELEKIAYSLIENILLTLSPNTENIKFAMDIAFAQISNENYIDSLKWIEIYENSFEANEDSKYAKFLIELNKTNELDTIKNYLSTNFINLYNFDNQNTQETLQVLIHFLNINIQENLNSNYSYNNIIDDRMMPSYFLINDIQKNMNDQRDLQIFILSLLSLNNKKWNELHPQHLKLILNAFKLYDNGNLIKPLILEILYELEIF